MKFSSSTDLLLFVDEMFVRLSEETFADLIRLFERLLVLNKFLDVLLFADEPEMRIEPTVQRVERQPGRWTLQFVVFSRQPAEEERWRSVDARVDVRTDPFSAFPEEFSLRRSPREMR